MVGRAETPATALPPEAGECATSSDQYTVSVGGTQGCTPPISEAEADCYEGAAVGAGAGSLAGPGGALSGGVGGCANGLRE